MNANASTPKDDYIYNKSQIKYTGYQSPIRKTSPIKFTRKEQTITSPKESPNNGFNIIDFYKVNPPSKRGNVSISKHYDLDTYGKIGPSTSYEKANTAGNSLTNRSERTFIRKFCEKNNKETSNKKRNHNGSIKRIPTDNSHSKEKYDWNGSINNSNSNQSTTANLKKELVTNPNLILKASFLSNHSGAVPNNTSNKNLQQPQQKKNSSFTDNQKKKEIHERFSRGVGRGINNINKDFENKKFQSIVKENRIGTSQSTTRNTTGQDTLKKKEKCKNQKSIDRGFDKDFTIDKSYSNIINKISHTRTARPKINTLSSSKLQQIQMQAKSSPKNTSSSAQQISHIRPSYITNKLLKEVASPNSKNNNKFVNAAGSGSTNREMNSVTRGATTTNTATTNLKDKDIIRTFHHNNKHYDHKSK